MESTNIKLKDDVSDSIFTNLFKALNSKIDQQNESCNKQSTITIEDEICLKIKYNDEKRQFQLKKPVTFQTLKNLLLTKFDKNLDIFFSHNDGELVHRINNQNDLDLCLAIYEKDKTHRLTKKLNLILVKKDSSSDMIVEEVTHEYDDELVYYRESAYSESCSASGIDSYLSYDAPSKSSNSLIFDQQQTEITYHRCSSSMQQPIEQSKDKLSYKPNARSLPKFFLSNAPLRPSILPSYQPIHSDNSYMTKNAIRQLSTETSEIGRDSPKSPQAPKNWKLGKVIGQGGFGTVNLCNDFDTGRIMATKHVKFNDIDSNSNKSIRMLQLEIEMLKTLTHERIVQYYGTAVQEGKLYIFFEYMAGGSLKDTLDRYGALAERTIKKYTRQIVEGLTYLHSHNVIHRDVKCSNVLCDTQDNVKLCDFGASKYVKEVTSNTFKSKQAETLIGTCHYMSPEIIKGEKYGRKVDIWSMGCTVVEMFTTKPPWSNLQSLQLIYRFYLNESPQYELPKETSSEAKEFLEKSLCLNYEQRPTAKELLEHAFLNL